MEHHGSVKTGFQNAHSWPQRFNSFTTSIFLALLYLHRRVWSSRTISLEPTHRHCPLPACCSEWQSHCPCSSCTYKTNSHPRLHVISSTIRKVRKGMRKRQQTESRMKCWFNTIFIHFNVYHDQNSMSERTSGLKCLLVVVILIFPLHALFYDRVGFWVFIFPIQEEQSRCHVLYSCKMCEKSNKHLYTMQ